VAAASSRYRRYGFLYTFAPAQRIDRFCHLGADTISRLSRKNFQLKSIFSPLVLFAPSLYKMEQLRPQAPRPVRINHQILTSSFLSSLSSPSSSSAWPPDEDAPPPRLSPSLPAPSLSPPASLPLLSVWRPLELGLSPPCVARARPPPPGASFLRLAVRR